jgi:hypothetical protein
MADEKNNGGQQQNEALDLHNIVLGENGKVEEIFDPESKKRFTTGGEEGGEQQPGKQQQKQGAEGAEEGGEEGQEQVIEFNGFHDLIVNKIMGNHVEFDPEMSVEEQAKIVSESVEDIIDHYEGQLAEAKKGMGLTPYEQEIVTALREGKNLADLLPDQGSVNLDMENKDAVVSYSLQMNNPSWTDEEVADELKHLKETNRFERTFKSSKDQIAKVQEDYAQDISTRQSKALIEMEKQEALEFEQEIKALGNVLEKVESLYGVPIDQEMNDLAFRFAGEVNPKTGQTRMQDLMSTPEGLAEVALLKLFGSQIMEAVKSGAYKEGRKETIGKYPDTPISTKKEATAGKVVYDLDKLAQVDSIGTFN